MTDLPFDFSDTLDAFECPETIIAYEKDGEYIEGEWVETKTNEREINCILLNVDEKKLEILAEGLNITGAYCVMFPEDEDILYSTYQQDNVQQKLQSYLKIDNFEYVVVDNPETVKNAGFRSYFALRFKEQVND